MDNNRNQNNIKNAVIDINKNRSLLKIVQLTISSKKRIFLIKVAALEMGNHNNNQFSISLNSNKNNFERENFSKPNNKISSIANNNIPIDYKQSLNLINQKVIDNKSNKFCLPNNLANLNTNDDKKVLNTSQNRNIFRPYLYKHEKTNKINNQTVKLNNIQYQSNDNSRITKNYLEGNNKFQYKDNYNYVESKINLSKINPNFGQPIIKKKNKYQIGKFDDNRPAFSLGSPLEYINIILDLRSHI